MTRPLWQPSPERIAASRLTAFTRQPEAGSLDPAIPYQELHRWSIEHMEEFWTALWTFGGVRGERGSRVLVDRDRMPGAQFFPDARLNFTDNILGDRTDEVAIIATSESGRDRTLTRGQLAGAVGRAAAALRRAGVQPGDRVAAMTANTPEAIIAALGAAAIGAVWSSCSPDFGVQGVLDRFGQIAPTVLITVDGYQYGGKWFDCRAKAGAVTSALESVRQVVLIPMGESAERGPLAQAHWWDDWLAGAFSVADIAMVTVLNILRHTDLVAEYPALAEYKARGEARPAYKRAVDAQFADFTPDPA